MKNELVVKIENEFKVVMTSKDVAEVTGKNHSHVMRDIRDEIEKLGKEIGESIFGLTSYTDKSNRQSEMYNLSRDGAMQLGARYDAKTRYKMIQRINELENLIGEKERLLLGLFSNDPITIANSHKELVRMETKPLIEKIEKDKPKVDVINAVLEEDKYFDGSELSKMLNANLGRNKLFEFLREEKVLRSNNEPYQAFVDNGCCKMTVVKTKQGFVAMKPVFSMRMVYWIQKKLGII